MVTQDCIDLSSFMDKDFLHKIDPNVVDQTNFVFSLEEIQQIAESFPKYDNSKLTETNGVSEGLPAPPCAVKVQPASPGPVTNSTQMLGFESLSLDMTSLQPVSPGYSIESGLSPYFSEAFTSDCDYLQPIKTEPFAVQPVSPSQHYPMAYSPQAFCLEPLMLHTDPVLSVEPDMSHNSMQIKEEAVPLESSDDTVNAPKKRGRKRKYPEGAAPSRSRPKKTKVYEQGPLQDEEQEKKRKNAINAKKHRDMQKNERERLAWQVKEITAERDSLQTENDSLRKQLQQLQQSDAQLRMMLANKKHQNNVFA